MCALAFAGACGGGSGDEFEVCDDGADNDGDGATDCDDSDCAFAASCAGAEVCDDSADNDGDGLTDCADPDCAAQCCGNGAVDPFEECDGTELGGEDCSSLGVGDGTLACNSECQFDFTACLECGNGSIDGAEECDGDDLGGATCGDYGFDTGDVSCRADCRVEDDLCYTCGDGNRDGPEVCDGDNLGTDCATEGFTGGLTLCANDCLSVDTTYCFDGEECTNGVDDDGDSDSDCADSDCSADCADSCASPTPLPAGVTVSGDTTGHANTIAGACAGSSAPEVVYTYTAPQNGELALELLSDSDLALHVRTTCGDAGTEIDCEDGAAGGSPENLTLDLTAGETVLIAVDGFSSNDGPYTLTADFTPTICGDGIISGPEACDDGNTDDGDACSSDCLTVDAGYVCANAPVAQIGANPGDTSDPTQTINVEEGTCTGDNGAREQVFSFTPGNAGETGVLSLVLESATDQGVYVREDCTDALTELACVDAAGGGTDEELDLVITDASVPLSIFVDGFFSDSDGPFVLNVDFTLDVCGDAAITGAEDCEPGDLGGATCEDVGLVSGTLACDAATCAFDTSSCIDPVCGDGTIEGNESCEDGNTADGDGCDSSCQLESDFYGFSCLADETLVMVASTDVPIVDFDSETVTSTVAVGDVGTIQRAVLGLDDLAHTYDDDLDIFLVSPAGTRVELTTDNGGSADNYTSTVFDDLCDAIDGPITGGTAPFTGCFAPEGLLSDLAGEASMGTWTLEITDDFGGDLGTLNAWTIGLCIE